MDERLDDLEPLRQLFDLGLGRRRSELVAQAHRLRRKVDLAQEVSDRFRAHARVELVTVLLDMIQIRVLG